MEEEKKKKIFNITQDSVIVIDPNWKIKQIDLNEFIIYYLSENNKWKKMNKFKLDIYGGKLERVPNTIFDMRINDSYLEEYSIISTELEIVVSKEKRELSLDVKVKRGDDYDEDPDDFLIKKKQKVVNRNKPIDILFFGVYHDDNESYLSKNFINSLSNYITELSSSNKLCCLWETPPFINNHINMNSIDGDTTLSFQIQLESTLLSGFTYLDSSILGFLFPLRYDIDYNPIINTEFDKTCLLVNDAIKRSHGIITSEKTFRNLGNLDTIAIQLSLNFILNIFGGLIDNNNDTEFLSLLFKDNTDKFLKNIRGLMKLIIFKNASKYDDIVNKTVSDYENKFKMNGDKYRSKLFMDTETIFRYKEHHIIIKEVYETFDLSEITTEIKTFMFETWSMTIFNHSKSIEFNDLLNEKIPGPSLKEKSGYSIDYDYGDITIDSHYFTMLFKHEIQDRLTIDISTLMFLLHFYYMKRDGIFFQKDAISNTRNTFVQFRDLFSYTNIHTITNNTPINRLIVFTGTAHIKHLNQLLLNDNFSSTIYNHSYSIDIIDDYQGLNKDVTDLLGSIKLDFHYYLHLEYIDYWFYETDIGKGNIDSDTPYDQLNLVSRSKPGFKLSFHTNQRTNIRKLLKLVANNNELEDIYMIISIYYGLLLSYYTPIIDHKYTNASESYFNTESEIKETLLNEYLYPYIPKDKIEIRNYRIIGEPLVKFTYNDDNDEETLEEHGNLKAFIGLMLEKVNEGYIINI